VLLIKNITEISVIHLKNNIIEVHVCIKFGENVKVILLKKLEEISLICC